MSDLLQTSTAEIMAHRGILCLTLTLFGCHIGRVKTSKLRYTLLRSELPSLVTMAGGFFEATTTTLAIFFVTTSKESPR
jgi:hypothetical protein